MLNKKFWQNKRVLVTGHTGFKGAWLCIWLHSLGAKVTGFALLPHTSPNLFNLCKVDKLVDSITGDVRQKTMLTKIVARTEPEIVIHMAAQSLVRNSYKFPAETYDVNVMGTVNLFEAIRACGSVKAVINVTSDKCYENKEWVWGYRESDPFGGYDPYSNSKACSELVTTSYRNAFFNTMRYNEHGVALASARAGNVIGGGDWAEDRLIPDCIRAILNREPVRIRNPHAIRPWQYVLEPLRGYLLLAEKLYLEGTAYAEGWNFGPNEDDAKSVKWIVEKLCELWQGNIIYEQEQGQCLHEANYLKLDCTKAKKYLGWYPKWNLEQSLNKIIEWYHAYVEQREMYSVCLKQIDEYMNYEELK